jgi:hypothetical protein
MDMLCVRQGDALLMFAGFQPALQPVAWAVNCRLRSRETPFCDDCGVRCAR